MYLRQRSNVDEGTKVPSRPLPGRPEHTSLIKSPGIKSPGIKSPGIKSPAKTNTKPAATPEPGNNPDQEMDPATGIEGVYIISVAARILEMHPQTLRKYERLGLINPGRTLGMLRLYSIEDIRKVRLIQRLSEMGLNLAGIEFALGTADNLQLLNRRLQALAEDDDSRQAIESEINALLRSLSLSFDD